ncbi:hypothetical protein V490_05878 [Pseudogymnoascus sp. VKM F-3557]|nr:hypothetical protein V490_05878 [Pseudogymnoascus sp. VKM F-3557]
MVVPFGFSVGDVIAGIGVIKKSIEAFSDTRGATKDHKLLSDTLTRLCVSLETVRELHIDDGHDAPQREPIRQAVEQCQKCIDDLLCKIEKYKIIQPSTQPLSWESRVKVAARKIQWALLKQDDLSKFRTDVQLQFDAINILLQSFQVHRQRRQDSMLDNITASQAEALNIYCKQLAINESIERTGHSNQDELSKQAVDIHGLRAGNDKVLDTAEEQLLIARDTQGLVQQLETSISGDQYSILQEILRQQASNFQLQVEAQSKSYQLLQQQFETLQLIRQVSAEITLQHNIPRQVPLQEPVVFRDALDRVMPIHLDLINSAEAFIAVLKVRFKDIGSEKLDRNEYNLTDENQNRNLDMRKPWCSVMKPGHRVSMSMVFDTSVEQNVCPGCSATNETRKGKDTACIQCGLTYRLIEETMVRMSPSSTNQLRQEWSKPQPDTRHGEIGEKSIDLGSTSEVTIADFRRVHLINVDTRSSPGGDMDPLVPEAAVIAIIYFSHIISNHLYRMKYPRKYGAQLRIEMKDVADLLKTLTLRYALSTHTSWYTEVGTFISDSNGPVHQYLSTLALFKSKFDSTDSSGSQNIGSVLTREVGKEDVVNLLIMDPMFIPGEKRDILFTLDGGVGVEGDDADEGYGDIAVSVMSGTDNMGDSEGGLELGIGWGADEDEHDFGDGPNLLKFDGFYFGTGV